MSLTREKKLQNLRHQEANIKGELFGLESQKSKIEREINAKKQELERLTRKVSKISVENGYELSEHALIRYFERVLGLDMNDITEKILTREIIDALEKTGATQFPHPDGYTLVIRNKKIITITKNT